MGTDSLQPADDLRLFHTGEHPCGYWPERIARDLVLDPRDPRLAAFYPTAWAVAFVAPATWSTGRIAKGVALRGRAHPGGGFQPDRSQRRCAARNAGVEARVVAAERTEEHLELTSTYLTARHRDGGMDDHGAIEFEQFLSSAGPRAASSSCASTAG